MDGHNLRTLVTAVQAGVTRATGREATADDQQALTSAWGLLLQHLALGPAPDTFPCPHCSRAIMRAASLCGYCWSRLAPTLTASEGE